MKNKKLFSFLILPLLLSSCSQYGNHYLMMNADSLFSLNTIKEFSLNEVENLMTTNNEFLIYFSSTGCSSCDEISLVLKDYLPKNKVLMFNLDFSIKKDLADLVVTKYPNMFKLETPTMYIVKGYQTTQIPASKLNSSTRISNSFNEYQHSCNLYYSNQNILEKISDNPKMIPFKNFGYVAFDFSNAALLNAYTKNFSSYLEQTQTTTILTNYNFVENEIYVGKYYLINDSSLELKNYITTTDFSNIDNIKKVLDA